MITEPNYNKINLKGGLNTIPAPLSNLSQTIASITSLIKEKVPPHNLNFNPAYLIAVLSKLSEDNVNNIANIIAATTSNNSKENLKLNENLIDTLIAVGSSNNEKNNPIHDSNHNLTIDTAVANIISLLETTKHYNNSSNIIQENTSNNKTIFEKINFLFSKFFRTSIFLFFYLIIFKIVDQILIFFSFNNTSNKIYLYWISFLLFLFALLPVKRSYLESSL